MENEKEFYLPSAFSPKKLMHVDFSENFASVAGKQALSNQQQHVLRILPPFLTKAQPMQARLSLKFCPFFALFSLINCGCFSKKIRKCQYFYTKTLYTLRAGPWKTFVLCLLQIVLLFLILNIGLN